MATRDGREERMRTATVVIGDAEYTIEEKRRSENRAWRQQLEAHFDELAALLQEQVDDARGLSNVLGVVSAKVLRSVDIVVSLVADYAPELPLEEAYESEIVEVFWAVLGLAYPFGWEGLAERIRGLAQSGPARR